MTTAEKYRQKEVSAVIQVARCIFNNTLKDTTLHLLGDVLDDIKTGKTPSKNEKRYYNESFIDWYKPNEIGATKFCKPSKDKLSKYAYDKRQATIYSSNTILINAIGDVGRVSILTKEASSNQQITGIKPNPDKLNIEYCYYYLLANRHLFYKDLFKTTLPIVNQKKIKSFPILLPSLVKQEHIVSFLNELEDIKSISDLNKAKWGDEYFKLANKFFLLQEKNKSISKELSLQLSLVTQLRQAFLREAMQGKLVEQDPSDEPASELLARIKAEKEQLIKEKKIRKQKPLPPIEEEEIPFEILKSWEWCRLGDITSILGDGLHGTPSYDKNGDYYFVNGNNLNNGKIVFKFNTKRVNKSEFEKYKKELSSYTILVSINGTLGNVALYNNEKIVLGKSACYFNLIKGVERSFIKRFIDSQYFLEYAIYVASETTIKNVSLKSMRLMIIPLPPTFEQIRIVTKLDELMSYCDQLEESIKNSQAQNEMLLGQVLREALEPDKLEVKV